jgi:hypothetical protein
MQEHILKLRDEANVHAFRQGDVSLIRLLREMCQVVFKLDAAVSTQKTIEDELQKRVVQLNHHQKAYRESMYALIRELNDIGKAGQFALLHFYNKIRSVHKAVKLEV